MRVSSLFGVAGASGKGGNFVETMIRKARAGEAIRVVDDIVMSPTYAADAALRIRQLIAGGTTGLVHAANAGACSWFEFARTILELVGVEADLRPQRSAELQTSAQRPRNSALEAGHLQPSWVDALRRYLVAKGHIAEATKLASGNSGAAGRGA